MTEVADPTPTTPTPDMTTLSMTQFTDLGNSNSGIIPEEFAKDILGGLPQQSALLSMARTVQMNSRTLKQPLLDSVPEAYWVDGDTGRKKTSKATFDGQTITAEEIAVILPIPENVIEDSHIDLFGYIALIAMSKFGKLIDQAGIFNVAAPTSWGKTILGGVPATNKVAMGTNTDVADDIAALGEILAKEGYSANGFIAQPGFEWTLNRLRTTEGAPIYQPLQGAIGNTIYGMPVRSVSNGAWDSTKAALIAADWNNVVVGIRSDIQYKWLDQAVITDGNGMVTLNLAEQDCVALRLKMRVGFTIFNPYNDVQTDKTKRFPCAILTPRA